MLQRDHRRMNLAELGVIAVTKTVRITVIGALVLGLATAAVRAQTPEAKSHLDLGMDYQRSGDNSRAIAEYSEAIRLQPNYTEAYYLRGTVHLNAGDHSRAIDDFSEAIRLYPSYSDAYVGRGNVYARTRDYTRALADCAEAIRLQPGSIAAHQAKGFAHEQNGQRTEAIVEYRIAMALPPQNEDEKRANEEAHWALERLTPPSANSEDTKMVQAVTQVGKVLGAASRCSGIAPERISKQKEKLNALIKGRARSPNEEAAHRALLNRKFEEGYVGRDCADIGRALAELEQAY